MNRILTPVLLAISLLSCLPAVAAEDGPSWYQIEIMLIANSDEANAEGEYWPELPGPVKSSVPWQRNRAPATSLSAGYRVQQLKSMAVRASGLPVMLPANWQTPLGQVDDLSLKTEARRINAQKGMRVVWHQAWIEAVEEQQGLVYHPIDLAFNAGNDWHLSGGISLRISRYLHLDTDLRIQQWTTTPPATLPSPAAANTSQGSTATLSTTPQVLDQNVRYPVRSAVIQQSRRMRSKELHFIDHPLMGILVWITPVKALKS